MMNDDPIKTMQTWAELNVVVCLRLWYKTKAEHRQLNHSIAIGKSVAVNLILGQPFIKGLQCISDSHSNTVNAQFIENGVFKVILDQTTIPHLLSLALQSIQSSLTSLIVSRHIMLAVPSSTALSDALLSTPSMTLCFLVMMFLTMTLVCESIQQSPSLCCTATHPVTCLS